MRFWQILFMLALFACGICLGLILDRKVLAEQEELLPAPSRRWGRPGELSVTRFAEKLNLTEQQDLELDTILEETHRDTAAYGRAMRNTHEDARERIMKILTEEQKQKLDGLLATEREQHDEREISKKVQAYANLLGLDEPQIATFRDVLAEHRKKCSAFFSGQEHDGDMRKIRDFFHRSHQERNLQLETTLSPEQVKLFRILQELLKR